MAPATMAPVTKAPAAKLPEYDKIRQQTQQRFQSQGQEQSDALQRRMASLGNLKSGAAIKQQQIMQNDLGKQQESALGQIDVQEAGELQRRQEIQDARDFAARESQLGRDFSSQEALKGRDFAAGESLLGRKFAASESALGRAMQKDQFTRSFDEQKYQNRFMNNMATKEFDFNKNSTLMNQATALAGMDRDQQSNAITYMFDLGVKSTPLMQGRAMSARAAKGGGSGPMPAQQANGRGWGWNKSRGEWVAL